MSNISFQDGVVFYEGSANELIDVEIEDYVDELVFGEKMHPQPHQFFVYRDFFRNHGSFCHQTGFVHSPVAQQFRDFPVQLFIVLLHGFRHQLFHGIGHFRQTIQMKCFSRGSGKMADPFLMPLL